MMTKEKLIQYIKFILSLLTPSLTVIFIIFYIVVRFRAINFIDEFDKELALLQNTSFNFDVKMKQDIPIEMEMKLSDIMDVNQMLPDTVHVKDSIKVNQTIPISENVTTTVNIPYTGNVSITIPIEAQIPINMTIPLDEDINIDDIEVKDQTVTIKEVVPVVLDFTVKKSLTDLGLTEHISQTHNILNSLRLFFLSGTKDLSEYGTPEQNVQTIDLIIE